MCLPEMNWKHLLALFLVTVAYVAIGGVVFSTVEIQNEERIKKYLQEGFESFLGNHSCVNLKEITDLFILVGNDGKLARIVAYNDTEQSVWDWAGASIFCVSVITTIGYGNLSPRTSLGQNVCVVYALFGIPLMLILLKDIGEKLYSGIKKLFEFRFFKHYETQQKVFNGIMLCGLSFTIVIGLPGYLFSYVENWTLSESFYFCFVTLTTIGFGDYIAGAPYDPNTPRDVLGRVYRWFVFLWIIVGLSFLSLVISLLSRLLANNVSVVEKYTRETLEKEINKLKDELTHVKNKYSRGSKSVSLENIDTDKQDPNDAKLISYLAVQNSVCRDAGVVSNDMELAIITDSPKYNKQINHTGSALSGCSENGVLCNSGSGVLVDSGSIILNDSGSRAMSDTGRTILENSENTTPCDTGSTILENSENTTPCDTGSTILENSENTTPCDTGSIILDDSGNGSLVEIGRCLPGADNSDTVLWMSSKESNLCKVFNNDYLNNGENNHSTNTKL